jgi:hypothetical protein
MYIDARGNRILDVVIDLSPTTILHFASSAAQGNYVSFLSGWEESKFINNNPAGAPNVVEAGSNITYSPGKSYVFADPACNVEVACTTQSITPTDGSIHTEGGVGIEKDLRVGGNLFAPFIYGTVIAPGLAVTGTTSIAGDILVDSGTPDLGKSGARFRNIWLSSTVTAPFVTVANALTVPSTPPASAGAAGTAGTVTWDAGFIYVCTATNTWKRAAIAAW